MLAGCRKTAKRHMTNLCTIASVHLVGADVDKQTDARLICRVHQHMAPVDICFCEIQRTPERQVYE